MSGKFYEPDLPRNGRDSKWSRLYPSNLEAKREIHALRHLGNSKTGGTWTTEKRRKSFHADPDREPTLGDHHRLSTNHLHRPSARNVAPACTPCKYWEGRASNHATSSLSQHHPRGPRTPSQNVITRRKSGKCPAGAC